jgi:imidazolonepropionase-like amidohydrolase
VSSPGKNQILDSVFVVVDSWRRAGQPQWHGGFGDPAGVVPTAITAARLIDGSGAPPVTGGLIRTDGRRITYCGPADADPEQGRGPILDLGDRTLMPGLIDCHAHPGSHPAQNGLEDQGFTARHVLNGAAAVWRALVSGVTTMRVTGAPGISSIVLRDAIAEGVVPGPRLLVAGPVICSTGGHGYWTGIEADGPVGVRRAARQLFKDGVDFLKLTATGGGTAGTVRHRATFTVEELTAAAAEAEQHDRYATAHVHGLEGMRRCLDAGIQMLEHGTFVGTDGLEHFDRALAERIRDQDVPVVPTVQVNGRDAESEGLAEMIAGLDQAGQALWTRRLESFKRRVELVGQLHEAGVTILMGSDGGGRPARIDDLAYGLELHGRAGVPAMAVISSATSLAARRLGIGDETGTLAVGKLADVIAAPGDPLADITAIAATDFVLSAGRLIRKPEGAAVPDFAAA